MEGIYWGCSPDSAASYTNVYETERRELGESVKVDVED